MVELDVCQIYESPTLRHEVEDLVGLVGLTLLSIRFRNESIPHNRPFHLSILILWSPDTYSAGLQAGELIWNKGC